MVAPCGGGRHALLSKRRNTGGLPLLGERQRTWLFTYIQGVIERYDTCAILVSEDVHPFWIAQMYYWCVPFGGVVVLERLCGVVE